MSIIALYISSDFCDNEASKTAEGKWTRSRYA
jgi:hypothetical protein